MNDLLDAIVALRETEDATAQRILTAINLYTFAARSGDTDLASLAAIPSLSPAQVRDIVRYFDGAWFRMPTWVRFQEDEIAAACLFLRRVKELSWAEIRAVLCLRPEEGNIVARMIREMPKLEEGFVKTLARIASVGEGKNLYVR